jgi:GNAT superfamily N-acetyltransferase
MQCGDRGLRSLAKKRRLQSGNLRLVGSVLTSNAAPHVKRRHEALAQPVTHRLLQTGDARRSVLMRSPERIGMDDGATTSRAWPSAFRWHQSVQRRQITADGAHMAHLTVAHKVCGGNIDALFVNVQTNVQGGVGPPEFTKPSCLGSAKAPVVMPNGLRRSYMQAMLREMPCPTEPGLRIPTPADIDQLASLMLDAYVGTVDYEGEDEHDALIQVHKTISGESGSFVWSCSRVIERRSVLASATLITRWENRPFVAFTMTRPEFKRLGLARACMVNAMQALVAHGEHEVRLMATLENAAANALYQTLGFRREE